MDVYNSHLRWFTIIPGVIRALVDGVSFFFLLFTRDSGDAYLWHSDDDHGVGERRFGGSDLPRARRTLSIFVSCFLSLLLQCVLSCGEVHFLRSLGEAWLIDDDLGGWLSGLGTRER